MSVTVVTGIMTQNNYPYYLYFPLIIFPTSADLPSPTEDNIVLCGHPGLPSHGSLLTSQAGSGYSPGDTVFFSCSAGYVMAGGGGRVCGEDGIWSGALPVCSQYFTVETLT